MSEKDTMLNIADCVEAHIVEVRVPEQTKSVRIVLRLVGGDTAVLTAECVDRIIANEFREQNIIDRITVWDGRSDRENIQRRLGELIGNDIIPADHFSSLIASEMELIAKGEKILVEIEPVYGVWLLMLTKRISIIKCMPSTDRK